MRKKDILVAFAPIGHGDLDIPLYPKERDDEIRRCKSDKVKREKYEVWKLLEKAIHTHTNLDFANLRFTKTDNGQWICPDVCFSISHTDGLVCVAVSDVAIGVDVELLHRVGDRLEKRILTDNEASFAKELGDSEKNRFLLEAWVKKESIFKRTGGQQLLPARIETSAHHTELKYVEVNGLHYVISVCADHSKAIRFDNMEEI